MVPNFASVHMLKEEENAGIIVLPFYKREKNYWCVYRKQDSPMRSMNAIFHFTPKKFTVCQMQRTSKQTLKVSLCKKLSSAVFQWASLVNR